MQLNDSVKSIIAKADELGDDENAHICEELPKHLLIAKQNAAIQNICPEDLKTRLTPQCPFCKDENSPTGVHRFDK